MTDATEIRIPLAEGESVSGLWQQPETMRAAMIFAHGAGAGMTHRFMSAISNGLAERGIGTLRYQFPYMEAGRGSPGSPASATATVRAAAARARELAGDATLFAAGKSYGGRMSSTAESEAHLDGVAGLIFFGFPLHAPGKPSTDRAEHLATVTIPMLFLQGTRDDFARLDLIEEICGRLGERATLSIVDGGNHSFQLPKALGKGPTDVIGDLCDRAANWMAAIA